MKKKARREKWTRNRINQAFAGSTRVAPGIWEDRDGNLHFSVPELLQLFGWPDTPAEREAVTRMLHDIVSKQFPKATVIETEEVPH